MNDKKLRLIHTVCGCVISAALIVAAVCLILAAYSIYASGDSPYTPESIGAQYAIYEIPLLTAVCAIILGILLNFVLPQPAKKPKAVKDPFIRLRILQKKYAPVTNDSNLTAQIGKEKSRRVLLRVILGILCGVSFVPAILSLCDYSYHTVDNLAPAILRTALWLAVGAAVSVLLLSVLTALLNKSAESEIAKTKIAISNGDKKAPEKAEAKKGTGKSVLRLVLVGVACALIVIGLTQDGFYDVLQKAIRICTECIGLG